MPSSNGIALHSLVISSLSENCCAKGFGRVARTPLWRASGGNALGHIEYALIEVLSFDSVRDMLDAKVEIDGLTSG